MQRIIDYPECEFCHSQELELHYSKGSGLIVLCDECGYSRIATNEHLDSEEITMLVG